MVVLVDVLVDVLVAVFVSGLVVVVVVVIIIVGQRNLILKFGQNRGCFCCC